MSDARRSPRSDVTKVYRRFLHQNQFRTLKSALLTGSLLSDLTPDQTFTALDGVSLRGAARLHLRRDRRERLGQVDAPEARSPASRSPPAAA